MQKFYLVPTFELFNPQFYMPKFLCSFYLDKHESSASYSGFQLNIIQQLTNLK